MPDTDFMPSGAVVRPKRRPKAVPALVRLPLEILERIFVLSQNTNLPQAHPVLGQRLSGRSTLVEFVAAAFAPIWTCAIPSDMQSDSEHRSISTAYIPESLRYSIRSASCWDADEAAAEASLAALQTDVLARTWATPRLLLDAQQLWLDRRGLHQFQPRHHLRILPAGQAWFRSGQLLDRPYLETLARAHEQQCAGECIVLPDLGGEADAGAAAAAAAAVAQWPRRLYTCHALEQAVFFEHIYFLCERVAQADEGPIKRLLLWCTRQPACVRVHRRARIPERLLLAGRPWPAASEPGRAAEIHRRLYDAFDRLSWLVLGGAQLQSSDSWEVTHEAFQALLALDGAALAFPATPDRAVNETDVYPTHAVAAGMVVLFHKLRVFSSQWPHSVMEAAEQAVRMRAWQDASFAQSMLGRTSQYVLSGLRRKRWRLARTSQVDIW